jgi:hypothetical protein
VNALLRLLIAAAVLAASCAQENPYLSSPAATASLAPPPAAPAAGCQPDPVKLCTAAGAQKAPGAAAMAPPYGTSAALPETVLFDIPGGPTIQVMCYYNPQRTEISRAEISSEQSLDALAIKFLRDNNLCAGA